METKFREISELMDDSNDKMPEGTYLALYNKLKELRDESNKNTDTEDDAALAWREVEDLKKKRDEYFQFLNRARSKVRELEETTLRSRPRCTCGSTTHRNPNTLCCMLNKQVLAGQHGPDARDRALAASSRWRRWRDALTVGTVIDAQDSNKKWFDAVITTVDGDLLGVHYRGWGAKWDDKNVPRSSETVQPLHTHTPRWREFTLGDPVEVRVGPGRKWYRGSVTAVNPRPRRVKITPTSHFPLLPPPPPMWLDFDSEDVCRPGTHALIRPFATLV